MGICMLRYSGEYAGFSSAEAKQTSYVAIQKEHLADGKRSFSDRCWLVLWRWTGWRLERRERYRPMQVVLLACAKLVDAGLSSTMWLGVCTKLSTFMNE